MPKLIPESELPPEPAKREPARYRMILVKYLPATNKLPLRIKLIDVRQNNKSITIRYDHEGARDPFDQAHKYLERIGFPVWGITSTLKSGIYNAFLLVNFEKPLR